MTSLFSEIPFTLPPFPFFKIHFTFWFHCRRLIFSSYSLPPHIYLGLLLIFTVSQHASITFKCHPGLHNNLIKTKEKRLASLKPLFSCRSVRPDIPPPHSLGLDVGVGGLYCSLVETCPSPPPCPPLKDRLK